MTIGFYTPGTAYEGEAERLCRSLDRVGMAHEIIGVPVVGDWDDAVSFKPLVLRALRERHAGGLLYVDVDAVVHENCAAYFEALEPDYDFAAHWFQGPGCGGREQGNMAEHLLSGTLWLGDTLAARMLLGAWIDRNQCAAKS